MLFSISGHSAVNLSITQCNAATIVAFNAWGNALEVLICFRATLNSMLLVLCAVGGCMIASLLHCYIATLLKNEQCSIGAPAVGGCIKV